MNDPLVRFHHDENGREHKVTWEDEISRVIWDFTFGADHNYADHAFTVWMGGESLERIRTWLYLDQRESNEHYILSKRLRIWPEREEANWAGSLYTDRDLAIKTYRDMREESLREAISEGYEMSGDLTPIDRDKENE